MALRAPAEDRRVEKTRTLLRDALGALIREKPYDAITVTEILDRANVGRSTFYMHFRDKDALLASGIRELVTTAGSGAPAPTAGPAERIVRFSGPLFAHIEAHRSEGHGTLGTRGWAVIHEQLRHVLADLIADDVREALATRRGRARPVPPPELLAQWVAATFVLTLNWWVESGRRLAARDANELFRAVVLPALTAILK